MQQCMHTAWVELEGNAKEGFQVANCGRLRRLIQDLPDPDKTYPQLIICLGGKRKRRFLRNICPSFRDQAGLVHLYGTLRERDGSTKSLSLPTNPVFVADLRPYATARTEVGAQCYQKTLHCIERRIPSRERANGEVINRLLLPFADVLLVFADDFGGLLKACSSLMDRMRHVARACDLPDFARPHLVVFSNTRRSINHNNNHAFRRLIQTNRNRRVFAEIQIISMAEQSWHLQARKALASARECNEAHGVRFTGKQMSFLFDCAAAHISRSLQPFNFIVAARSLRPVSEGYPLHLQRFLQVAQAAQVSSSALQGLCSVSLLLDAYQPGTFTFTSERIFDVLYSEAVRQAFGIFPAADEDLQAIRSEFCRLGSFNAQRSKEDWAKKLYVQFILESRNPRGSRFVDWSHVKSKVPRLCFLCHAGANAYPTACEHPVCENCIARFGEPSPEEEYSYIVRRCILCDASLGFRIALRPPSAGVRVLSIDGGGVRGIGPLRNLQLLQQQLGFPIQDAFDLIVGTSVGGLTALAVFKKNWSLDHFAEELFPALATKVFSRSRRTSIVTVLWSCLEVLLTNRCLNKDNLNRVLIDCLGVEDLLVGCSSEQPTGNCKVAVTASSSAKNVVMTTYHASRERKELCTDPVYDRMDVGESDEELLLWQAAAATAAVPSVFPPLRFSGSDYYDGSLAFPNPVAIARKEGSHISDVDTIVSLGTGFVDRTAISDAASGVSSRVTPWKSALSTAFDPHKAHKAFEQWLRDTGSTIAYHRLDVEFQNRIPRLDDLTSLSTIIAMVDSPAGEMRRREVELSLIASCFFFELTSLASLSDCRTISCKGVIRLRGPTSRVIEWLDQASPNSISFGVQGAKPMRGAARLASFKADRKEGDVVNILLRLGDGASHKLSGFPRASSWFIEQGFKPQTYPALLTSVKRCICRGTG